jgi:Domain of unknown function (DUF4062)
MDKRYQIFVSSTYDDLKDEREIVIQTLMKMGCIPAGMELFPAADEEQFEFIKKVIDDCDYYLLIIGGRYGSTTSEGLSYTEKEYDYAIKKGIKVIALIHGNPNEIQSGKTETAPKLRKRLEAFRKKVSKNRLVNFWTEASQLSGFVALNVTNAIRMYPAVGWVRADQIASVELLNEVNELRKNKERLEKEVKDLKSSLEISIFTPQEETEFNYIYSKLKGVHNASCRVQLPKDISNEKSPRRENTGQIKYSLLKQLLKSVSKGETTFTYDFLYYEEPELREIKSFSDYLEKGYDFYRFTADEQLQGQLTRLRLLNPQFYVDSSNSQELHLFTLRTYINC